MRRSLRSAESGADWRGTLEERGEQRRCGRTALGSGGSDRSKSERRNQPDEKHGEYCNQRAGSGVPQHGRRLAAGTGIRKTQDTGMSGGILALTAGKKLEYRVREGFGALPARFGAGS